MIHLIESSSSNAETVDSGIGNRGLAGSLLSGRAAVAADCMYLENSTVSRSDHGVTPASRSP
jgi:hypothetical protein